MLHIYIYTYNYFGLHRFEHDQPLPQLILILSSTPVGGFNPFEKY